MNYPKLSFLYRTVVSASVISLVLEGLCFIASASVLLDITSNGTITSDPNGNTFGWSFSVGSQNVSIAAIGIWDKDGDGLSNEHAVGLWTSGGTLMGSATIKSGLASVLIGGFRYENLPSPVTLLSGSTYYLGALYPTSGDELVQFSGTYTYDSLITYDTSRYSTADSLSFPSQNFTLAGVVGPNAMTTVVPEPQGIYSVVCIGLLGLAFQRWKKN